MQLNLLISSLTDSSNMKLSQNGPESARGPRTGQLGDVRMGQKKKAKTKKEAEILPPYYYLLGRYRLLLATFFSSSALSTIADVAYD